MRRLIPFLLLVFTITHISAQNALIPDAAFKSILLNSSPLNKVAKDMNGNYFAIDANGDKEIQLSEALQVSELDASSTVDFKIHSSEGINYFANIRALSCTYNYYMETFTVSGFQYLARVSISTDLSLHKVTITNNPVLTSISIADFETYAVIDTLIYSHNNLSSLVICAAEYSVPLKYLDCSYNHLSTLDLETIRSVRYLDISNNNFTDIYITNMTLMKDFRFENNPLKSFVFQNTHIKNMVFSDFIDLKKIDLSNDPIGEKWLEKLTLTNLPALESLNCTYNKLTQLSLVDLPSLKFAEAKFMYIDLILKNLPSYTNLDLKNFNRLTGLTISGLSNVRSIKVEFEDYIGPKHLEITDMEMLTQLYFHTYSEITQNITINNLPSLDTLELFEYSNIPDIEITDFPNLKYIKLSAYYNYRNVHFNNLPALESLLLSGYITPTLEVQNLPSLSYLDVFRMNINNLKINGLPELKKVVIQDCDVISVLLNDLPRLYSFNFEITNGTDVTGTIVKFNNLPDLNSVRINAIKIDSLDFSGLRNLNDISLSQLTNLDALTFSNLPNLHNLNIRGSKTNSFVMNGLKNLTSLTISGSSIGNFNNLSNKFQLNDMPNLSYLALIDNSFSDPTPAFYINDLNALYTIIFNQHGKLYVNNLPSLFNLKASGCFNINSDTLGIYLSNFPNLHNLVIFGGWGSDMNINLIDLPNLTDLSIGVFARNIDLSGCPNLNNLDFFDETWSYSYSSDFLNLRNGNNKMRHFNMVGHIKNICVDDDSEKQFILSSVPGLSNTNFTYDCAVTPNNNYNTIKGVVHFDYDNNGCQSTYSGSENIKLNISTDGLKTVAFTTSTGEYNYYTTKLNRTITLTPQWENPYFTCSPQKVETSFSTFGNDATIDFCALPIGIHNDVDVVIIPVTVARPGFDAVYKIVYRNKGNVTSSGTIELIFNDEVLDFVSSNSDFTTQNSNSLSWQYTDLLPFTTGEIFVTLNLNSPQETPSLNANDILNYTASITPQSEDETPADNIFIFKHGVVNAVDPNDKICLEGESINLITVGDFVHYMIRFENTGSANAINVLVKDLIDTTKFDIRSLVPVSSSHSYQCSIKDGNRVEFAFTGINLPYADPENKGYILFKIKTLESLKIDDSFSNKADIYFDYNAPVYTNEYITAVALNVGLVESKKKSFELIYYPNPVKDLLKIQTAEKINKIEIFDISGRIVMSTLDNSEINIAKLNQGAYFIRVFVNKKVAIKKIIKI